jgi:hypothetical protein
MRILLRVLLPIVVAVAARGEVAAQLATGSQLGLEENRCVACHGESDLCEDDTRRLYIPKENLAEDIHFRKGVNCHDCHGGDPSTFEVREAHATAIHEQQSPRIALQFPLEGAWKSCVKCHEEAVVGLASGAHARLEAEGQRKLMDCRHCHGEKAHDMVSVRESRVAELLDSQVKVCGSCHEKSLRG